MENGRKNVRGVILEESGKGLNPYMAFLESWHAQEQMVLSVCSLSGLSPHHGLPIMP